MTTKKLLSLQLKRLLTSVAEHGNQHLGQIEADLLQTDFLLAEAIEKLNGSFLAIHAGLATQWKNADSSAAEKKDASGNHEMEATSAEITAQLNAVVTGLQFQDMTSQLIGRALQRLAGLSKVLEILGASSSGMAADTGIEEIVELLNDVNQSLEQQSGKLQTDLWKAVRQTHMESGDIELF